MGTAGLSKPWFTAVTFEAMSAWLIWVLRINSALTTEMPTSSRYAEQA